MKEIFLGFDFGTYSTKIAFCEREGNPRLLSVDTLSDEDGIIYSFISKNSAKIGREAYESYKRGDKEVFYGFKMKLDTREGYEGAKNFLKEVYSRTMKMLSHSKYKVKDIRFSAPNSWVTRENEQFLRLLEDIGAIKNYKYAKEILAREPYAAAIYHIHDEVDKAGKRALILDAGAGTIDTMIVDIKEDGSLEEVKGSYETSERAGRYVDERIMEFYKLPSLWDAESLKFHVNHEFRRGKDKARKANIETVVERNMFENECLKDWVEDFRTLLGNYDKHKPDYLLFAGGFSTFYLLEEIVKEAFPYAELYPVKGIELTLNSQAEFKKDISIALGCARLATGKAGVKETLKFDLYLEIESITGIRSVKHKNRELNVLHKGGGKYLVPLFDSTDYTGKALSLRDCKINNKPFLIKQYGVVHIIQRYKNREVRKELPLSKFKGEPISNIQFVVDKNKLLKVIYEYEDGSKEILTQADLKTSDERE